MRIELTAAVAIVEIVMILICELFIWQRTVFRPKSAIAIIIIWIHYLYSVPRRDRTRLVWRGQQLSRACTDIELGWCGEDNNCRVLVQIAWRIANSSAESLSPMQGKLPGSFFCLFVNVERSSPTPVKPFRTLDKFVQTSSSLNLVIEYLAMNTDR